jgi:SNF2 family DNA or RNA helicase
VGVLPKWNAKDLLNPRIAASSPSKPTGMVQQTASDTNGSASYSGPLTFMFTNSSGHHVEASSIETPETHASVAYSDVPAPTQGGLSESYRHMTMLQRVKNVQDRGDLPSSPSVKRRRIEEGEEESKSVAMAHYRGGGSSGLLDEHLKERKKWEETKNPLVASAIMVDLTEGKHEFFPTLARPGGGLHLAGTAATTEDRSAQNELDTEVCYGMVDGAVISCHRVPSPKPGMAALLGANFWPQVKVVLRRKVDDPGHLIHVYDYTRQVFGTIDAKVASGVAPLLDSVLRVRSDCRIASRRKAPGEVLGEPTSKALRCELMLYGPRKYARQVGGHLMGKGIKLVSPPRVDAGIKVLNPHSREAKIPPAARAGVVDANGDALVHSQAYGGVPMSRTVEEVRTEVMGLFDSLTKSEDLPEVVPDAIIQTPLLKHQKQGLYFMLNREKLYSQADAALSNTCWQRKTAKNGQTVFYNVVTGQSAREHPPDTLGGILADMMGLGKTLSVLALLANTMDEAQDWARQAPIQPKAPEKKVHQPHQHFNVPQPKGFDLTPTSRNSKTTLLICPLSTITNWEEQIKQHVKHGAIKYHIYHGQARIRDVQELSNFDLVITTYGSVSTELTNRTKRKMGPFPLEEIGWFRIVLDEAHMIREQSTLQFKAACRLQASRRWAVTGTPVQNRLDDLAALLAFLRMKPFDDRSKFVQHIVTPFKNCDPEIVPKLRVLIDTITLRRLKDKIDLPPRTDELVRLDFSEEEQRIYDLFAKNAKERVQALTSQRGDRIMGGRTYVHILQSILRLRLICAHGKELLNEDDLQLLQGMTADNAIDLDSDDEEDKTALSEAKAYEMFELIKQTNNDNCVSCGRKLGTNEVVDVESEREEDIIGFLTPCFHVYCPFCIQNWRDVQTGTTYNSNTFGHCPVCEQPVKFASVELRHARADVEHESHLRAKTLKGGAKMIDGYSGPHTKTKHLLEDLLRWKAESEAMPDEPPIKSVVFSGWTSHLDLIQLALENRGITCTRLDGKMTRIARTHAMDAFRDDNSVHVMLVSIMAGGLGLNLTAASNVYVMEPQYNPAAEAQAIDRIHRLGQKRPVRTVRYIMKNSFEEKMLELQDKKKKLANLSMDDRDKKDLFDRNEAARQRLNDLRTLFK